MNGRVIPRRHWQHKVTGCKVSIYGACPWWNQADAAQWEKVESGYTIQWNDGTVGNPAGKPFASEAEAVAFLKDSKFSGFSAFTA